MDFFDELPKRYRDYVNSAPGTAEPAELVKLWYTCLDMARNRGAMFGLENIATDWAIQSIKAELAKQKANEDAMALRKDGSWGGGRPVDC
jgi:hypothetical protein